MKQYKAWELLPEEKVYLKSDVDAAIAELKSENKMLKEHIANGDVSRITWIDEVTELKAENESLKAKLESVQASAYADSVDANMENRILRRALWLTRALRARDIQRWWLSATCAPVTERACRIWNNVERKCRAKAKEYL